jgi:hypothetical protein
VAADPGEVETVLRVTPVFRKLAPQDLRTIAQAATIRHYDRAGIARFAGVVRSMGFPARGSRSQ